MVAWRRQDWGAAAMACQPRWYVAELDPIALIKAWYGWRMPVTWAYVGTEPVTDTPFVFHEVRLDVAFDDGARRQLVFRTAYDTPQGRPVPADDPHGVYGPNPISGLRGLS